MKYSYRLLQIDILLSVSPKPEDLILTGISDDYVEVGTDLDLNCTINRIKPEATEMFWIVSERRENGSDEQTTSNSDGTLSQTKKLLYK